MKKIQVALIQNIISPYRVDLLNEVAKNNNISLTVYFLNKSASDRLWNPDFYTSRIKFNYIIVPSLTIRIPFSTVEYNVNPHLFFHLLGNNYSIIIGAGWVDFACQIVPFFKRLLKFKYILWAGSTIDEKSLLRKLFNPLVTRIISQSDSFISYGSKSKKYLIKMGADKKQIVKAYNSVNSEFFSKIHDSLDKNKIFCIRKLLKIPKNDFVVLYVGQFIKRKNIENLIISLRNTNKLSISLVLVGYGPLKNKYKKLSEKYNVKTRITNYLENNLISLVYSSADLFILPSKEEVWGLVVNEAMASKLPVIISSKVGCKPDLIKENINGFIFDPNNTHDLRKKILFLKYNNNFRKKMGENSYSLIKSKDIRNAANKINEIIEKTAFT